MIWPSVYRIYFQGFCLQCNLSSLTQMTKHHFLLLLYFKVLQKGLFDIYVYEGKFRFLILIIKMPFSAFFKRQCYYTSFLCMSVVHVEKAFRGLRCAPVFKERCIGYAWFLATCPLFSRLHLKYFLECLPFQPPWKQLAFCWSFMGKQSPAEYFCDSFYLLHPPSFNADEYLFHTHPP